MFFEPCVPPRPAPNTHADLLTLLQHAGPQPPEAFPRAAALTCLQRMQHAQEQQEPAQQRQEGVEQVVEQGENRQQEELQSVVHGSSGGGSRSGDGGSGRPVNVAAVLELAQLLQQAGHPEAAELQAAAHQLLGLEVAPARQEAADAEELRGV